MVGALVGWYLWVHPAPRRSRSYLIALVAGWSGGKLLYSALHGGVITEGGLDLAGALLAGALAGWFSKAPRRQSAPLFPILAAFGAVGQWCHGAAFGTRFQGAPWLERLGTYPAWENGLGSPAWRAHLALPWTGDLPASLPTHPVQLYEALAMLLLAFVVWRRNSIPLALLGCGAIELSLTPLREDAMVAAAFAPVALMLGGIALFLRQRSAGSSPANVL